MYVFEADKQNSYNPSTAVAHSHPSYCSLTTNLSLFCFHAVSEKIFDTLSINIFKRFLRSKYLFPEQLAYHHDHALFFCSKVSPLHWGEANHSHWRNQFPRHLWCPSSFLRLCLNCDITLTFKTS